MSVFTNNLSGAATGARQYIDAVLGMLGTQDPLVVLDSTPMVLATRIENLDGESLSRPESPGKWSIAAVLQHLADSDLVWSWRLRLVLAEDRPKLTGYDQDLWAQRLNYAAADAFAALDLFRVVRRANLRLLRKAGPNDLNRFGVHVERGEESVAHMIRLYAGHDLVHVAQIDRILGR